MTLTEQKQYLDGIFKRQALRSKERNAEDIKAFGISQIAPKISKYLLEDAWKDDSENNTRVFLVRDKRTKEIVCYYALNCGALFEPYNDEYISPEEKVFVDIYVNSIIEKDADGVANMEMAIYSQFPERADELIRIAKKRGDYKKDIKDANEQSTSSPFDVPIKSTIPAIHIKYLCMNPNYSLDIDIDFKLGVYIFWEIMVPHMLKIAKKIGCKYVYLFAADNSLPDDGSDFSSDGIANPDSNSLSIEPVGFRKLIDHYTNEFKFHANDEFYVPKPHYERKCYTMVQKLSFLERWREGLWISHDENRFLKSATDND